MPNLLSWRGEEETRRKTIDSAAWCPLAIPLTGCRRALRANLHRLQAVLGVRLSRPYARSGGYFSSANSWSYIAIHGVNSFGSPFPSCAFIFAFGVPSTSPVTEAVAMIGAIK